MKFNSHVTLEDRAKAAVGYCHLIAVHATTAALCAAWQRRAVPIERRLFLSRTIHDAGEIRRTIEPAHADILEIERDYPRDIGGNAT